MNYYSTIAKGYNKLHGEEQKKKFALINGKLNGLILDIGSGTGISRRYSKDIVQLEPSFEMLRISSGRRVCGMAEHLPFKDNTFDCIISITSLHHTDIKKAVKEIRRVSKKDARYAFSILKKSNEFNKIKYLLKKNFKLEEIDEEKDLILVNPS